LQEELEDTKRVWSESVNRRRTDNTKAKRKRNKKLQTTIYKTLYRNNRATRLSLPSLWCSKNVDIKFSAHDASLE